MKFKKNNKQSVLTDIESLPVDQYSRQKWAHVFIEQLRKPGDKFSLVDVGGYKGKTTEFQLDDNVTVCDLFDSHDLNYIKGDGRKLPFEDNKFDFAVTFDTYEHIPRQGRKEFIKELIRVSSKGVILAAPFDNDNGSVFQAEVDLNNYHQKLYEEEHPWLKEHIEYRIPSQKEAEILFNDEGVSYTSLGSNDLNIWILMQTLYFSIGLDDDLRGRVDDINRFYNSNLMSLDVSPEQTYRRMYFFSKDTDNTKIIEKLIESKTKKNEVDETKSHFIAYALSVWGQKYRDVVGYKDYLEKEVERLKQQQ